MEQAGIWCRTKAETSEGLTTVLWVRIIMMSVWLGLGRVAGAGARRSEVGDEAE